MLWMPTTVAQHSFLAFSFSQLSLLSTESPAHIQKNALTTQLGLQHEWRGATDLALSPPLPGTLLEGLRPLPQHHEQALDTAL